MKINVHFSVPGFVLALAGIRRLVVVQIRGLGNQDLIPL
jgi:hypothetical protein